jgi:Sugar kinases, ribokinase family
VTGGVLCCGNLVLDILVRPVEQVVFDATTWVEDISQHVGGNGANTSFALGKLGVPVRLVGVTGRDSFGDWVLGQLEAAGVDTRYVLRKDVPTAATVGLVKPTGSRAFLHRPGVSAHAFDAPVEFTADLTTGFQHFHLANPFALPLLRTHAGETMRSARQAGLRTSLDTGWDAKGEWMKVIEPCLPHTEFLFMNEDEARRISGCSDAGSAARRFLEAGAGVAVVKLGAAGCSVFTASEEFTVPGFRVDAVDTTGAGDCFVGGFLAGLYRGASLREAARLANAAGALSVTRLGATTGLLSYSETVSWMSRAAISQ